MQEDGKGKILSLPQPVMFCLLVVGRFKSTPSTYFERSHNVLSRQSTGYQDSDNVELSK